MTALALPADDAAWLTDLKKQIQGVRQRAALAINSLDAVLKALREK